MSIIGLIPARSGSKRIPDKNITPLAGHPLMAYTIASALQSGIFSKVIISTDSERYAEIAQHYGAEVPFLRSTKLAGEQSTDIEWVEDVLQKLKAGGQHFEAFSILRPTSPFRQAVTIQRAYKQFISENGIDSIRAVEKCKQHPGKMWVVKDRRMTPLLPQKDSTQTSMHSTPYGALPEVYAQNASLEMAYTRVVFEDHSIAGKIIMPFFTEGSEGVDINEPEDLWYAQHLLKQQTASLPLILKNSRLAKV